MTPYEQINQLLQQGTLTAEQINVLINGLTSKLHTQNTITILAAEQMALLKKCREGNSACPHCGSITIAKNGLRAGRQRYVCKDCRRTFGDTYGTMLWHSRLKANQWNQFIKLTLYNQSIPTISRDLSLNRRTVWYNRHKLCSAINQLNEQGSFEDIVEGDEYYNPLSFMGTRNPTLFIERLGRLPRHNRAYREKVKYVENAGYNIDTLSDDILSAKVGIEKNVSRVLNQLTNPEKRKRGISNEQVAVLTCVDRSKNSYLSPTCVGKVLSKHVVAHLSGRFSEDSILVTDSHVAYRGFAKSEQIHLEQIPPGKHNKGAFNLARVNSYHSRLDSFLHGYKQIATRYLDHYVALFRWQDEHRAESTVSKTTGIIDILTQQTMKLHSLTLKNKALPLDMKGIAI